jgi:glycosyltransferase involved in cell wall biosynthesis
MTPSEGEAPAPIERPYLICLNVPSYRDSGGDRYLDPLWHRDVLQHAAYLKNLTIAGPCRLGPPPIGAVRWPSLAAPVRFIDLPDSRSVLAAILPLPLTAARLWKAIGRAEIVHTGIAGWPIPLGWLAAPMSRLRGRASLIIVESAPWRLAPGLPVTRKKRLKAALYETLGGWCVRHASLVIVTQAEYGRSLLRGDSNRAHVIPASWIDAGDVLSSAEAAELWRTKRPGTHGPLKLLFAGRLEPAKGVAILLDAMRLLSLDEIPVELDILGAGELFDECRSASESLTAAARIRMLGTVPYGPEFFHLLGRYHAVVVPSLSDEQPRIVYDAFSQAVPVLASNTAGLRDCVQNGQTGLMSPGNNPEDWASTIRWCLEHGDELPKLGAAGLEVARPMTHEETHLRRRRLLDRLGLDPKPEGP